MLASKHSLTHFQQNLNEEPGSFISNTKSNTTISQFHNFKISKFHINRGKYSDQQLHHPPSTSLSQCAHLYLYFHPRRRAASSSPSASYSHGRGRGRGPC